ncbi:hypothetical protein HOT12_gp41 [Burkholderia phage vB_BmuP_KL4]|uniref:Uncharacterized protein n=1 Tax=Burkholderia phage vB_BmuP_KL4 TaxID=2115967 RepID=A0A2S1GN72_9CAUD|nr:hypothetical protein HOT12_gp41 [Burkholderia phage vB_BmuP_KL4]AWD90832.1 hypothetical protein [Burkholderia phage vB_BmuP_KL4]
MRAMAQDGCGNGLFIETINRPCWSCEYWSGVAFCDGSHAMCTHPRHGGVVPRPRLGCASWSRATGLDELDDETCDRLAHQFARPTRFTVIAK